LLRKRQKRDLREESSEIVLPLLTIKSKQNPPTFKQTNLLDSFQINQVTKIIQEHRDAIKIDQDGDPLVVVPKAEKSLLECVVEDNPFNVPVSSPQEPP
jgi:hypothetical protein